MRVPSLVNRSTINEQTALTPLIDVIFQLLIFFMCASTGHLRELQLSADLPAGVAESAQPAKREQPLGEVWIRLKVTDGKFLAEVEGRGFSGSVPLRETLRAVAQEAPEIPVILDIQPQVPMGWVIEVYDACRAAGFRSVNFAAEAR